MIENDRFVEDLVTGSTDLSGAVKRKLLSFIKLKFDLLFISQDGASQLSKFYWLTGGIFNDIPFTPWKGEKLD